MLPNFLMASGSFSGPSTMRPMIRMAITSPPPRLLKMASTTRSLRNRPQHRLSAPVAAVGPHGGSAPARSDRGPAPAVGVVRTCSVAVGYPSLLDPPIGFAHRGARAHAPENTLDAFAL